MRSLRTPKTSRPYDDLSSLAHEGVVATTLAASPFAMVGFFAGWIAIGLVIATMLARRGHDMRTMVALGVGLGPLMVLVGADTVTHRERASCPRTIVSPVYRSGRLDVLVLIHDRPADVESLAPTLAAVERDLRTLTFARAIAYELLDEDENDADHEAVSTAATVVADAVRRIPIAGAGIVLWPGTVDRIANAFRQQHERALVLLALPEPRVGSESTS